MDEMYNAEIVNLGIELTKLAVKGTATAVSNKIRAIKNEKNTDRIRATYDEIVNELLSERDEALRIAQSYKSELENVVISDEDINNLHNTVSRLLEVVKENDLSNAGLEQSAAVSSIYEQVQIYEQIKELISVDTLKTMQLLGFNYKTAIGEPLTIIMKNYLMSKAPNTGNKISDFLTPELVEVLKNDKAYKNFKEIIIENATEE